MCRRQPLDPLLKVSKRLVIRGHVQGVGFRYSLWSEADRLGVSGWVRNLPDGTVEAAAYGPPEAVAALIRWAHVGPRLARVERVEVADDAGIYQGFELR
jgi:acylphosphatase